jgi:Raf kinase inhibitor-like YbhB/YbcL family protein
LRVRAVEGTEDTMAFRLESKAFPDGGAIPDRHTCDGPDLSPPLNWSGAPDGTEGFALVCDDPDAPVMTWVHWVVYGMSAEMRSLPEDVKRVKQLPDGTMQGTNSWKKIGYGGPCPPRDSTHRYYFKLYAVDRELTLAPGAEKKELLRAMEGAVLAQAGLMGTYRRE